jgi:GTP-dependent phosphoenolpyruvate carboxykinase
VAKSAKCASDGGGLDVSEQTMADLRTVSKSDWEKEVGDIGAFFGKFGSKLPAEMERQRQALAKRVE